MADYMVRAMDESGSIRAFVATATALADEARRRHDTWPTATAALGRALTGTALLSATLKDEGESITLRLAGDGPIGGITCDADEQGQVRGFVREPHVDLDPKNGKFDVAGAVGGGYVHITRQLAIEGIYTGTSEIVSGEIGDDLAYYLTKSEQTPSAVSLGVRVAPDGSVRAAGGVLLQLLPATSEEEREQLEVNLQALGAVSMAVESGMTPEEILGSVLAGIPYKILEKRDIHFACRCTRERALSSLASLSKDDLHEMIHEDGGAELVCQFCAEKYQFSADELREIHGDTKGTAPGH
ncbi:MAG TPA: Hsp33 family molecular chaperone HslO [Symbiobacteriaceae bacterium]|nr:Hsp33 family molecular chaperone HslO [Symbiobacteriaceae bacterium]